MKKFFNKLITSGLDSSVDIELRRKMVFLNTTFLIGIVALPLYGIRAYIDGKQSLFLVDCLVMIFVIAAKSHADYTKNPTFAGYLSVITLAVFFFYLVSIVGMYSIGWSYVFPLLALFLLGPRKGIISIGCFMTGVILFFVISPGDPFFTYHFGFKIRFIGSFLTVALFAYFFEHIRISFQKNFEQKNRELEKTSNKLLYRAEFEHIITTLSSKFVRIEPEKVDEEIDRVLKIIGQFVDVDRSYIFLLRENGKTVDNTHEWCAEGIEPQINELQGFLIDDMPWIAGKFRNLEDVYIPSVEKLPTEALAEKEIFTSLKIKSLVCVPLVSDRIFRGFLGFDSVKTEKTWPEEIIDLLRIIGEIIIRTIERTQSENEKNQLQEKLHQSRKMEAIGQLAGGIAHDFNNILGAISGYADMIKYKFAPGNPKLEKYARTILSASERAADLTAKLLAFARRGKFQISVIDLHTTIQDVINILHHTLDKNISIVLQAQPEEAMIKGDPSQIQNAIFNLAINARDAMPDGGTLTFTTAFVSLSTTDKRLQSQNLLPGTYIKLSVSDTGTGIDRQTKRRLFEPFFTTKEVGKGTGLGLASVYGTIKDHNGFIEVESQMNRGTTFIIFLPQAEIIKKEVPSTIEESVPVQRTASILLVDDEEMIRDMATEMLNDLGYPTVSCSDGRKGYEYYRDHYSTIDLVILDVVMPTMGGYECFINLKKINPGIKVIISSGYSIDGDARKILKEGALDFIQKPFSREKLIKKIENIFHKETVKN